MSPHTELNMTRTRVVAFATFITLALFAPLQRLATVGGVIGSLSLVALAVVVCWHRALIRAVARHAPARTLIVGGSR